MDRDDKNTKEAEEKEAEATEEAEEGTVETDAVPYQAPSEPPTEAAPEQTEPGEVQEAEEPTPRGEERDSGAIGDGHKITTPTRPQGTV